MTDRLGDALERTGAMLDYPDATGIAHAVRLRLDHARRPRRSSLRLALAALVLLIALSLALPVSRGAIARLLGVGGVRVTYGPAVTVRPGGEYLLGRPATLEDAKAQVSFPVTVPAIGRPDAVYVSDDPQGGRVTLIYPDVLVSQFEGSVRREFMGKVAGAGTRIEDVDVAGVRGLWLTGAPHAFFYLDRSGAMREETLRLAANALLWERGGITYRIETRLPRSEAIRIATTMR